jgi:hypothetical protein
LDEVPTGEISGDFQKSDQYTNLELSRHDWTADSNTIFVFDGHLFIASFKAMTLNKIIQE